MAMSVRAKKFNVTTISPNFPGVSRVFKELQKLGLSTHIEITGNEFKLPPETDILILGAWIPEYVQILEQVDFDNIGILWTSTIAQSEMSGIEISYINQIYDLLENGHIEFVWFGDKSWLSMFDLDGAFYIPYPITLSEKIDVEKDKNTNNISLFCPSHPRKNIINQLIAVKKAQEKNFITLNTNNLTPEYEKFARKLELNCNSFQWLEQEEYLNKVASMDLGLQVSHVGVESFNYVVIDHMCQNIPTVMSRSIYENYYSVVGESWLEKYMCVENPCDTDEIAEKITDCLENEKIGQVCRKYVEQLAVINYDVMTDMFRRIFK